MRLYKEVFWAIVQTNLKSLTENFANIGVVVSSKLIELRKSPSPPLVGEILKLEAFKEIKQPIVSINVTESQITNKVFEGCVNSASCCICSKTSWFGSHQLC